MVKYGINDPLGVPSVQLEIAQKFGIISIQYWHGDALVLTGAVIEGKEYGKLIVSNQREEETVKVDNFSLSDPYPNPFNPVTNIRFTIPVRSQVSLVVYDMLGREVATLVNEMLSEGEHTLRFDASKLANGMYLYKLRANGTELTRKMTLIK